MPIKFEEGVVLASYTTFKIGGPARYFFAASNTSEILAALENARSKNIPLFILAGGSNVLFSDQGFDGLVLFLRNQHFSLRGNTLRSEAGAELGALVRLASRAGKGGLEWAGGLPGTVGGAVRGNAGAFGGEMKDVVQQVLSIEENGQQHVRPRAECGFNYRNSIFKTNGELILEIILTLRPAERETLEREALAHIRYREEKHPLEYPNAGSIFKNIPVERIAAEHLLRWKDKIKTDPFPVVPTACVIADAGLKGLRVGGAQVSLKHTNYIVNLGGATARDVRTLIEKVRGAVKEKFGIALEVEIQLVGAA